MSSPSPSNGGLTARASGWVPVAALAALAVCGWLPFVSWPLRSDEAGLLMVAEQWGDGSSLYGDYWVDRPPLLVGLYALASAAGGAGAVRVLGLVAVAVVVLLAGWIGRLVAPSVPWAPAATAGVAAAGTASRLLGSGVVNGEILAVPFVLAGLGAVLVALRQSRNGRLFVLSVAAGLAGAAAVLVKQNFVDVFVLVIAVVTLELRRGRAGRVRAGVLLGGVAVGAATLLASVLVLAVQLGSAPGELWFAVVTFRGEAASVIADSASLNTPFRFVRLLAALVGSGLPLLLLALLPGLLSPPPPGSPVDRPVDLRLPAAAVLAWELLAVVLGGSYWLHYLMGLVPGVTLLVATALPRPVRGGRRVRAAALVTALSAAVSVGFAYVLPADVPEEEAIGYLEEHARPGETGVVAFGHPNVLQAAGLSSPYPDLWSLSVRVRDPDLARLTAVLAGPRRPDWLVVEGDSLTTWGVDGTAADAYVDRHYTLRAVTGDFRVYRVNGGA